MVSVTIGRTVYDDSAQELALLVKSDNLEPCGLLTTKRDKPDPAYFIGSGKVEELGALAHEADAQVVVFDVPLSAAQQRNIERAIDLPVLDRTQLILDIFRARAKSREGRLQVELAQLEHLSTRLVRGWTHLERQRGGLSKTGGPGEKQIELDRRMIGVRMKQLREQLKRLKRQRDTQRRARSRGDTLTVSLVGYTNAGKSTLLNSIAGVFPVDEGHILIDEVDVTKMPEHQRAKFIGRVFQDPMKGTAGGMMILENLAMAKRRGLCPGLSWSEKKAETEEFRELVAQLGLGLENRLTAHVGLLSGGQRQAITLLMATLVRPKLLLLDEHTAALDPKTAEKVLEITNRIVAEQQLTTLMITHNMRDALRFGNRLIMMHDGRPIVDVRGEEKARLTPADLLRYFEEAGDGVSDKLMLG